MPHVFCARGFDMFVHPVRRYAFRIRENLVAAGAATITDILQALLSHEVVNGLRVFHFLHAELRRWQIWIAMRLPDMCGNFADRISPIQFRNHELQAEAASVDYCRSLSVLLCCLFGDSVLLANLSLVTFEKVRLQFRCGIEKLGIKWAFQEPLCQTNEDCIGHG